MWIQPRCDLPTTVFINFITTDVYVLVRKHSSYFVEKFGQKIVGRLLCGVDGSIDIYGIAIRILALGKKSGLTSFPGFCVTCATWTKNKSKKGFVIKKVSFRFFIRQWVVKSKFATLCCFLIRKVWLQKDSFFGRGKAGGLLHFVGPYRTLLDLKGP